jgi:glycosyltransferase involved in cell wall biosynthesis
VYKISKTISHKFKLKRMNIYILDPVCIKEAGHNLVALNRYANYLQASHSANVIAVASKHLPERLANGLNGNNIVRFFDHYYNKHIPIPALEKIAIDADDEVIYREVSAAACVDALTLFRDLQISGSDFVFYPSIDYFSLIGLLSYLKKAMPESTPRFVLRWIGVMENKMLNYGPDLTDLLVEVSALGHKFGIVHTAESLVYAQWLTKHLDAKVSVTPTLATNNFVDYADKPALTLSFPGAARRDKGFDRLPSILSALERLKPDFEYMAYIQLLQSNESKHYSIYAHQLTRNSSVVLLPTSISDAQLETYIGESNIIVLPYDPVVYQFRSSAIMAEAAMIGRYVIASNSCGFSSDIVNYQLGDVAETDEEFADKILNFAALSIEEKTRRSEDNRKSFTQYISLSYEELFE